MRKDFLEILSGELIAVTGGLLAGLSLAIFKDKLLLIPGLFILLPGLLEMRGNISGSLAARIGSALHLGTLSANAKYNNKIIVRNIFASFLLVIFVSLVLGSLAYVATLIFFKIQFIEIIYISVFAAIFSNIILLPLTIKTSLWLYKKGHDPDNIMGPYITTIGDVVCILAILLAITIVV
jgi:mgtE-like transporter